MKVLVLNVTSKQKEFHDGELQHMICKVQERHYRLNEVIGYL
jgi:hypothetical protein